MWLLLFNIASALGCACMWECSPHQLQGGHAWVDFCCAHRQRTRERASPARRHDRRPRSRSPLRRDRPPRSRSSPQLPPPPPRFARPSPLGLQWPLGLNGLQASHAGLEYRLKIVTSEYAHTCAPFQAPLIPQSGHRVYASEAWALDREMPDRRFRLRSP